MEAFNRIRYGVVGSASVEAEADTEVIAGVMLVT